MRYHKIVKYDVINGPGLRTSIFFTGCTLRCKGCFNFEIWNPKTGKLFNELTELFILELLEDRHCAGLSVLGGEPTDNGDELVEFLKNVKQHVPEKTIWLWTGRTMQQLIDSGNTKILEYVDVLVDGPFIESEKDANLKFRGSKNQRIWTKTGNIWTYEN